MTIASQAIAQAWANAETNADATAALQAAMDADPAIYRAIMDPHVVRAASDAVGDYKRSQRSYLWTRPIAPDNRVAALARANAASLLDMRLPNGKRLADATAGDVAAARDYYAAAASQMAGKASFFGAVLTRIKRGKTVAQSLDGADLQEIKDAA